MVCVTYHLILNFLICPFGLLTPITIIALPIMLFLELIILMVDAKLLSPEYRLSEIMVLNIIMFPCFFKLIYLFVLGII